ncbi:MAG: M20 family metallopeptidase, partial [Fidelibacterota bacterium]
MIKNKKFHPAGIFIIVFLTGLLLFNGSKPPASLYAQLLGQKPRFTYGSEKDSKSVKRSLYAQLLARESRASESSQPDDLIEQKISEIRDRLIKIRRHIHMYPELSNKEYRTSKFVANELKKMGLEVSDGWAGTGVVGLLKGGKPGAVVALRADMDALPIQELTGVEYASKNKGVMHACGHDVHTTIALGAAMVLSSLREEIAGTVKFIFQPAEEAPSGELGGAKLMVQ